VKILITGGKGFIGRHLVARLTSMGLDTESFDIVDGDDLKCLNQLRKKIHGKAVVFHLAAVADLNWARKFPLKTMDINLQGTWNVAQACVESGAGLYFTSTMCVYGNQKVHPSTEETLPSPSEIYACSKLAGESIVTGFHHTYGLQYNIMRFATIYGEGTRPALATHIFLGQAMRGEPITIHGDGTQTRTLTHVDDLIDAILALYQSGKMNDVWNMSTTEEVSVLQMAQDAKRLTRSKSPVVFIPQRVGQTHKESISADKMLRETGWQAKISWNDGIERMYKWFVDTDQVKNTYQMLRQL
jgi:UDP-glucose 4-epimerase